MKGNKRYRSGAWRLTVAAGTDPLTGRRKTIYETFHAPDNRVGAKAADARLAELIVAVESDMIPDHQASQRKGPTVTELATAWQESNRPHQDRRTGEWLGWSPKTAMTVRDNFDIHILPAIGSWSAERVTGVHLDRLYRKLEDETGLSASVVLRCHGQIRAMFNWALRKKMVTSNPALAADPPRIKPHQLKVPLMSEVRGVQQVATPDFAAFVQLAATVGARRGTLVALRWRDVELQRSRITFSRSIAQSAHGQVEKGTKADRAYAVALGPATTAVMAEHRRQAEERARKVGLDFGPELFVFSDDGGLNHWDLAWPSHAWKRYSERAKMAHLRLHDLRHTAASQMLMAGVAISIVAERLGCTEMNILRNYRHFIPGSDQQAAELMDRLLGAPLVSGESGV